MFLLFNPPNQSCYTGTSLYFCSIPIRIPTLPHKSFPVISPLGRSKVLKRHYLPFQNVVQLRLNLLSKLLLTALPVSAAFSVAEAKDSTEDVFTTAPPSLDRHLVRLSPLNLLFDSCRAIGNRLINDSRSHKLMQVWLHTNLRIQYLNSVLSTNISRAHPPTFYPNFTTKMLLNLFHSLLRVRSHCRHILPRFLPVFRVT